MEKAYYAIIPANVRYDKDLRPNAKLLYGEITALCNEKGYCWATNNYFAELYGVSKKSISNWISQLIEKKFIYSEIKYRDGTKEVEQRYLKLSPNPIEEKFHTYRTKVTNPIEEKFYTPMEQKVKENNTFNNNTFNNLLLLYEKIGFGTINDISKTDLEVLAEKYTEVWVAEAMKEANEQGIRNLKYVKGILGNWKTKGFKAKKGGKSNGSTSKSNKDTESSEPQYNFSCFD